MDFAPLPERPEAQVLSIEDILDRARSGRIRVPRLQRGLRWERTHVIDLFDSLVRGYPIGSILVNQAPAPAERVSFGPVEFDVPARPDAWWLVDGQQRVTSLVAALLHPEQPPLRGQYAVWVNLRTAEFDVQGRSPPIGWLPLNVLGDRTRLHQWARTVQFGPETDAMVERAFELEKILVQYKLTAFVVREAPAATVRAIFGRTNNAGVRLEENEVVEALFGDDEQGKPLSRLATDLDAGSGFGRLNEAWLLRCVKAVAGHRPNFRFDERHQLSAELVDRTRSALARTLSFIQRDARIPHASVLPYRFPLIVLAALFDRHPSPHDRSRELLVRWLWRGAVSQVHARSSTADTVGNLNEIGEDEDLSVQGLLHRVPREIEPPDPRGRWNVQASFTRIHACAVLARPPLDPRTLDPIDPPTALAALVRDERTLSDVFIDPTGQRPEIAARVFWPWAEPLTDADPAVLESVGIDEHALDLLADANAQGFVEHRAAWATDVLRTAIERYASPQADDRPPIAAILGRAASG